jgi:hypothetical protein
MILSQVAAYYTLLEGLEPAPRNAPIRRAVVQPNNRRSSRNNRDRGNRRNDGNNGGGGNGGNAPAQGVILHLGTVAMLPTTTVPQLFDAAITVLAAYYAAPTFPPAAVPARDANTIKHIADLELPELTSLQPLALSNLLRENVALFNEGLGRFTGPPLSVKTIGPNPKPFHRKAYRIPHSKIAKAKAEVEEYVRLGIWKPNFDSPWGSPTMFLDKPSGDLRLVTDFREVNKLLCRKPYPMPKIDELFQNIDGYDYATILDLQKGFYHVALDEKAQRIFTTVLPWGKYTYQQMPMGYAGAPDVFQHQMDQILGDLPFCACFIDDIGIWTKGSCKEQLEHLETVFAQLTKANLRVNIKKSDFVAEKMTSLGFQFTKQGICTDPKQIVAVQVHYATIRP